MDIKQIRKCWILAKIIYAIGTAFWINETIFFLIVYGWHFNPINESEQICDDIVSVFWLWGTFMVGVVIFNIIESLTQD